ncbi:hypothetical protein ACJDU8_24495 [Clostridium sp. WILCCON 0269]|uniref:Uncharacterized protein n=1 Tax=Candidatus Clostridium eludens TaxID=3381663 RepID=A0ABW8SRZ3_9CLOT
MSNKLRDAINRTIELEFEDVNCKTGDLKVLENTGEYKRLLEEYNDILRKLSLIVPSKIYTLIIKIDDISVQLATIQAQYFYKMGVISGLTNLRYLGETKPEIVSMKEEV